MRAIALLLLCAASASGAASRPVSVAVLAGADERAPDTGVLELLMTELSGQDGVALVEREQIAQILTEHDLSALTAAGPSNAVRLGRLLAADLLVVVDRLSAQDPIALRLRIIETRTSIVLADLLREESDIAADASLLRDRITLALTRWQLPPEGRRYVAILGARSEEVGRQLSGVPAAIGMLLAVDLSASPTVVLLDRASARRLQDERNLTAMELDIKSSMIGLELFVRLTEDRQSCRISVAFSMPDGTRPIVSVETPLDQIVNARRPLVDAVLRHLDARTTPTDRLPPKQEADILGLQPGEDAAEAAWLIDPTRSRLVRVAYATSGTRSRELMRDYWRNEFLRMREQGRNPAIPDLFRLHELDPLPTEPDGDALIIDGDLHPKDSLRLANWWARVPFRNADPPPVDIALEKDILRYRFACDAAMGGDGYQGQGPYFRDHPAQSAIQCIRGWAGNTEEWAVYLKQVLAYHLELSRRHGRQYAHTHFITAVVLWQQGSVNPHIEMDTLDALDPIVAWMNQQNDPLLGIAGYAMKVSGTNRQAEDAARKALAMMMSIMVNGQEDEIRRMESSMLEMVSECFIALSPADTKPYLLEILRSLIERNDADGYLRWVQAAARLGKWYPIIDDHMTADEALDFLCQVVEVLTQSQADSLPDARSFRNRTLSEYQSRISKLRGLPSIALKTVPPPTEWREHDVRPFTIPGRPKGNVKLGAIKQYADKTLFVWRILEHPNRLAPVVVNLASDTVAAMGIVEAAGLGAVAFDGASVAIAADDRLIIFNKKQATVLDGSRGLPMNRVTSMEILDGRAYFGVAGGALYSLDMDTLEVREQASSRRELDIRNPLDGGVGYTVASMLAGNDGKTLWIGVSREGVSAVRGDVPRPGLWRYVPDTDSWSWEGITFWITDLAWCRDWILFYDRYTAYTGLYDPQTGERSRLFGNALGLFSPVRDKLTAGRSVPMQWPAVVMGNRVITPGYSSHGLNLSYSSAKPAAVLMHDGEGQRIKNPSLMVAIDERKAIVANLSGQAWTVEWVPVERDEAVINYVRGQGLGTAEIQSSYAEYLRQSKTRIPVVKSSASSVRNGTPGAGAMSDAVLKTCWSAATNDHVGAWVEFEFKESSRIERILVANGCTPSYRPGHYPGHHRAKQVTLIIDDGRRFSWRLHDVWFHQEYTLPEPVATRHARIVIDAIYPALINRPADVATLRIAEVVFFGACSHGVSPKAPINTGRK